MSTITGTVPVRPATGGPRSAPQPGLAARALVRGYLRYVSAVWRGDEAAIAFATRLDGFWANDLPPVPAGIPAAISPHGGGGHGIWWFETVDEVRGYVSGADGGYRVPLAAVEGLANGAPGTPGRARS